MMNSPLGINLACRSSFSIGESTNDIKKIVHQAKELGYHTLALCDTMTVSGMPDFMSECKSAGIKPIMGVTLRVYDDSTWRKPKKGETGAAVNPMHTLKVLVRTESGMRQLYKLLSLANDEEHFYYNSRVSFAEVLSHLQPDDVFVLTGDQQGLVSHASYMERAARLVTAFGNLYVELVPVNTPLYDTLNLRAENLLGAFGQTASIFSFPVLYPKGGADSADVHRAISTNNQMSDRWLPIPYTRDYELVSPSEAATRFQPIAARGELHIDLWRDALRGMVKLAGANFYSFEKKKPSLPKMAPDEFIALVDQCKLGWLSRFSSPVLGHKPSAADLSGVYKTRLAYELGVIRNMGFSGYFLLVQEIVQWSKSVDILVGPGRGSVGGSLIAYLMGITDVDPIRFELLFERFINPERLDLPDADLDFMSSRRHEVIEHIVETYGADRVAGISNYTALGSASAIRDVARVHGLDALEYACSKQVEKEHGVSLSLAESQAAVAEIDKFAKKYPAIWAHSLSLEGCMRGLGTHAAGVVVAGEPVINRAVVSTRSGSSTTNWDKRTVEDHGLIKMDILGLSTLDILGLARQYVLERHKKKIDYLALPLDDDLTLKAFGRGETVGIFQFESSGMRKLLTDLAAGAPLTFDDLCATTALFRPGPLDAGLTDEYVQVKQGHRAPHYENENMRASLEPTFGIVIYQEQVMQLSRDLSGFTLAEADHLRKAIGKKDAEKMAKMGDKFIQGAITISGMSEYSARSLWDQILGFAAYSFNKSHSYEYSILSYWAMWVKTHYPAEFYAAAMSVVEKEEKLGALVLDARKNKIETLPPDINLSTGRIEIRGENELIAPFQSVKGISGNSAAAIVALRELAGGKITSIEHLEATATHHKMGAKCNKTHRERLDLVGAFHAATGLGKPPMHLDRLKDRLELMAGFTVDAVKATRGIEHGTFIIAATTKLNEDIRKCDSCSLKGSAHVMPRMGRSPKFMMVFDSPTFQEEKAGRMFEGDTALYVKAALKDAGLNPNDGYYTSIVKAQRPKGAKSLATEMINGCSAFLEQEIALLKPPVIITMGTAAAKHFSPGLKGNPADYIGKVIYNPDLDASIVFGLNPAQILFDSSKVALLQKAMGILSDLI